MKRIYLILGVTILFIIIVIVVNNIFIHKYPEESHYLNYLTNRYKQDFIIESKIEDTSDIIDDSYCEAYNCSLKSNDNIKFIVGYGKIKPEVWSISKHKMYFDTYREVVESYLQNKYKKTIEINDISTRGKAVEQIKNIVEQYRDDYVTYGLTYGVEEKPAYFNVYLNIKYYDRLIENVKFYNYNNISDTLEEAIQK